MTKAADACEAEKVWRFSDGATRVNKHVVSWNQPIWEGLRPHAQVLIEGTGMSKHVGDIIGLIHGPDRDVLIKG